MTITRRDWLQQCLAGLTACALTRTVVTPAATRTVGTPLAFGFSLYGMKTLPLERGLQVCADIGYSGVELACMKDWPTDPDRHDAPQRRALKKQLTDLSLELPCLMENLGLAVAAPQHAANLERWKQVFQFAHDVAPADPPVVETVLGGKPEQWATVKGAMVDALGDWERVARASKIVLAIKPHAFGALHRPDHAAWLVEQINSPWVKAVFDYSHYERQQLTLAECLDALLPHTVFVHIKDNHTVDGKLEFALPGEGTLDYADYFKRLRTGGYRGAVVVEVSAQVSGKPGYDPAAAAERCYGKLHPAFEQVGARARV